ncbi:uncharacterized protein MELLADRAFT_111795 [Melampsora larici-populina 98AG31]|uniref:Uncharacterized protein n=1 Tax=Melampsora larici-populina (strain 98AG31 / pathotype 3-4-7) TaxID=747676 RepID=F4S494_MELLP|nr:uncharacterized protein MELLADRAFT_111795 [Melampsora larici-populina 98AG31]EGG00540.1 hypothetical protein MELLADRAFT_111795 [Melampsora larici-populina 98AG31]
MQFTSPPQYYCHPIITIQKAANKCCPAGPADAHQGDNSSTDEDLVEIMNYKIRSRCGLGHPDRPNPVDLAANFTDFADKMVANNLIKIENEPFASAFQSHYSSSEVADGFRSDRLARCAAEASKEIYKFRSRSPNPSLQNLVPEAANELQSLPPRRQSRLTSSQRFRDRDPVSPAVNQLQSLQPRHSSEYSALGARKKHHQSRLASANQTFLDPASGTANPPEPRSPFKAGKKRYHFAPYPPRSTREALSSSPSAAPRILRSQPPLLASALKDSSSEAETGIRRLQSSSLTHGFKSGSDHTIAISKPLSPIHDSISSTSETVVPEFIQRSTQKMPIPRVDLTFEGNVSSAAQTKRSSAGGKKENDIPTTSSCHCRLSTTRSILASGLGPLENLLENNMCNGYMYKETAHIFLRMFNEVRLVQDCVEHVHNCPNSVI